MDAPRLSDPLRDVLPDLEGTDDLELRNLVERAHLVTQMTQHPGWGEFTNYLLSQSMVAQNRLCDGYASDFADYLRLAGYISGVREALNAADNLNATVARKREQAFEYMEDVEFERGG